MATHSVVATDLRLTDSALRNLVDGLVLIDTQARIMSWNPHAEQLLRLPADEILGQPVEVLIDEMTRRTAAPDTRA